MAKTVVIIGTLDTKGQEFAFIKKLVEKEGLKALVVDFGVMGKPAFRPDVTGAEVAEAGGGNLDTLRKGEQKDEAMRVMQAGLAAVVRALYDKGKLDGIIGMGGTGGTSIATAAMRTLPVGVPKVMVSTVGGGDVSAYAGTNDIILMPSIVDVAGFNRISRTIYANAAGAIAAWSRRSPEAPGGKTPRSPPPCSATRRPASTTPAASWRSRATRSSSSTATGDGRQDHGEPDRRRLHHGVARHHHHGVGRRSLRRRLQRRARAPDGRGPRRRSRTVLVPGCVDMCNFWGSAPSPKNTRTATSTSGTPTSP